MIFSKVNKLEKIEEDLYVIREAESVNCYLIIGSEKAVLFDVGYGYEDVMPVIREITSLPVMLVLSHGDPDHGLGAGHFEEVWLHELDWGKLLRNDTEEMRRKAVDYRINKMPEMKDSLNRVAFIGERINSDTKPRFLKDRDIISLGDKELLVLHTPGHSYGHIMLLDKQKHRLFSGDQITKHNIWYFLSADEQAPFEMCLDGLYHVMKYNDWIDEIYPAHNVFPIGKECLLELIECLEYELPENYKKDEVFHSFMGDGYQHFYKTVNFIYSFERLNQYLKKRKGISHEFS